MRKKFELVQAPKITHQLNEVGKEVEARISRLDLENQVITDETIKSAKLTRAELNKEHAAYKADLKIVKDAVSNPYIVLQDAFKTNITEPYAKADTVLKDKITFFETKLKDQKKTKLIAYFNELIEHEKIDFLKFEDLKLNINLTTSEKKLKEQTNEFIDRIIDDLALIKEHQSEAKILVEYKVCLNASKAITTINKREADAKLEADKIKLREQSRRKNAFLDISMIYDSTLKVYRYNDEIYVTESKVNESSFDDFNLLILTNKAKIDEFKKAEAKKVEDLKKKTEVKPKVSDTQNATQIYRQDELVKIGLRFDGQSFIHKDVNFHWTDIATMSGPKFAQALEGAKLRMKQLNEEVKPITKPISTPKIEEVKPDLELLDASFTVTATMPMLQSLVKYLKENNYTYKTIE